MRQLKQYTMRVTPKIATQWLEANVHNRAISDRRVKDLAAEMAEGRWVLNGEAIIFDSDGNLADGQHRLWACITANVPFETTVTEGVSKDAFATIDTGAKRSATDVFFIDGVKKNSQKTAVAVRLIVQYEKKILLDRGSTPSAVLMEYYRDHSDISWWVDLAISKKVWATSYAAPVAAVCYLAARRYPAKAEEFLVSFMLGENLQAGSPVLALRNRLGTEKRLGMVERTALVAQAWNAFIEQRKLARMVLFTGDKFPTIKGA